MVITSSTQWTIPLNGSPSSFSASSPCLTRQGSVLGLKTCQLSAPQHAINASSELHLHDLHSTSSRRLQGAEYAPSRRSAGSFRQLFHEDFSAKLGQEDGRPCPPAGSPPDWAYNNKESEGKYDGIAMPWSSSSPLRHVDADSAAAFNGNLVNVHGDITADDVDLLPMPGLLSCSSPFYADSYITHTQSPENTRSIEISSSESPANSSKSSVMVSNYLGLPPDFNPEIAGMVENMCHASAPLTPPISIEHARGAENHFSNEVHAYNNKETDNFTDSLAGLWSNTAIGGDSEHMVHGSESLASIFNVYPQSFHDFSSSDRSCIETCDNESVQLIIDDLQYLVNPSIEGSEDRTKERESLHGSHEAGAAFSGHEKHKDMVLEATHAHEQAPNVKPTHAHGQSPNVTPQANASEEKSSIKVRVAETSAMPHGSSSTARSNEETASPSKENGESLGIKRPFSALDLASMASSMMSTSAWSCGSNAWRPQPNCMGLPVLLKEHEEPHSFSSFLYKSQKDPKLAGLHYHMATKHGGIMDEDSMPKPPPTKVRRKHGTAMDPQSVAARTCREKFSDRIRILQSLVPNGERLDTVSMLGQTLEYVRFLQHQVWELYHGKDPASSNICEKWKDFIEAGLH